MTSSRTRLSVRTGSVLLGCCLGLSLTSTAEAATPAPNPNSGSASQGNSGTIKVSFPRDDTAPGNDAKPGCTVRLDLYGFSRGTYQAVFNAIAPTGSKQLASGQVTVTQPRTPASAFQTSRRFALDVSGLTPGNAGYHVGVKVTSTSATASGGSKSKTFTFPCVPGNAVSFSGGSGSLGLSGGAAGTADTSNAPRGGFATGAGGSSTELPVLPAAGLLAGLSLIGAGVVRRRRVLAL